MGSTVSVCVLFLTVQNDHEVDKLECFNEEYCYSVKISKSKIDFLPIFRAIFEVFYVFGNFVELYPTDAGSQLLLLLLLAAGNILI